MLNDLLGQFIGPYQIIESLGSDGSVDVYRGHHPQQDRQVMVRIAGRFQAEDAVFTTRFRRETRAINKLRHPNIPRLHDFGSVQNGYYLVVDLVAGVPLAALLEEARAGTRAFTPEDITFIVRQVAAALDHAHSHAVTHQEVTPFNILLTRSGQAFLDGFGLAMLRTRGDHALFSVPAEYLAPEQLADPLAATPSSDIYSLGVVLYELLTGLPPFEPGAELDDILRQIGDSAPDPRLLVEDLPPVVAQVVLRTLSRSPRDRFHNAMQVANALEWGYANPDAAELPLPRPAAEPQAEPSAAPPEQAPAERVVIKRRPTRSEERRERARLQAELRRIKQAELAEQRRVDGIRRKAERKARQERQRERRRQFLATWGRTLAVVGAMLLVLAAGAYGLQSAGILSIGVTLPTLPTRPPARGGSPLIAAGPTETVAITPTGTPPPTLTFTPTPLQGADAGPVPTIFFMSLDVGTSAYRLADGAVLQFIPAGRFEMGTNDARRNEADRPRHLVMLTDYWLDRYEVTNDQYRICVEAGQCQPPRDQTYFNNPEYHNYPVTFVNYEQAVAYCLWLARETDLIIGLPTEAQWEKAAGWDPVAGRQRLYPWGSERPTPERMQFIESGAVRPASPVGSHPAGVSFYGAHDMAGNVWEWVADWFDPDYYKRTGITLNPTGPLTGGNRVTRGGSWTREGGLAVTNFRNPVRPVTSSNEIGFRCALNGEQPPPASRVLLTPLDVNAALIEIMDTARRERTGSNPGASPEDVATEFDAWLEALNQIDVALKNGENGTALRIVDRQLARLNEVQSAPTTIFAGKLALQLGNGLAWVKELLTPRPAPTPIPTPTATATP